MRRTVVTVTDEEPHYAPREKKSKVLADALAFFAFGIGVILLIVALYHVGGGDSETAPMALRQALQARKYEVTLMAGQGVNLINSENIHIHIQSDYPIVANGLGCRAIHEVDVTLDCGPSNVTVMDLRPKIFITARANHVSANAMPN